MDIISHGLWGSLAFGRSNRKNFSWAFLFGVAPDLFSFGIFSISTFIGLEDRIDWSTPPHEHTHLIPDYVYSLYNVTHSLVIFAAVFLLVYLILRKPFWPMLAWGLHIVLDMFTHYKEFFATPFLWPLSDFKMDGTNWSEAYIFFPNVLLLIVLYAWFYFSRRSNAPTPKN